jgi:hypothetical protein
MRREWSTGLAVVACVLACSLEARAQVVGSFTWQLQPYCNRVTATVTQTGGAFTVDGFDDQCGGATRIPASGMATLNPDGSVSLSLTMVGPLGVPYHLSARLSLPAASGPWKDSRGDSGTLVLGAEAPGDPRPVPGAVVDSATASGNGINPSSQLNFIGPTVTVTVTGSGQRVHLTASKALGSVTVGGGLGLTIYACSRSTVPGSSLVTAGAGVANLRMPQNTRILQTISHVFSGLAPGTYELGMCGSSTNFSTWNDNNFGYATALVFQ